MNVVDSSGWIEFLTDSPNARWFSEPIKATDQLIVPSIVCYEVYRHALGTRGADAAQIAAGAMSNGMFVELDREIATTAAEVGLQRKFAAADSIVLATATLCGATLWTQDVDFRGLAGVKYRPKTNA